MDDFDDVSIDHDFAASGVGDHELYATETDDHSPNADAERGAHFSMKSPEQRKKTEDVAEASPPKENKHFASDAHQPGDDSIRIDELLSESTESQLNLVNHNDTVSLSTTFQVGLFSFSGHDFSVFKLGFKNFRY